jgi:NADPH:quinone reductase-like Zn-dependent oxidoreductase
MPVQVQFNKEDRLEDIKVVKVSKPTLNADDEALVKFILSPINATDIESIQGVPGTTPSTYPAVAGVSIFDVLELNTYFIYSTKVLQ